MMDSSLVQRHASKALAHSIRVTFCLYVIALMTSMSAMEIFGWLTATLILLDTILLFRQRKLRAAQLNLGPEIFFAVWLVVGALGLLINAPQADFFFNFATMRWIPLFYFLVYGIGRQQQWTSYVKILLGLGTLIATYGVIQHFTGFDLRYALHIHNDSRVTIAPFEGATTFQVVGFFGHHLTYGYSFGIIFCFAFAAWILTPQKLSSKGLVFGLCALLLGLSVYWTYGRGVWIATALSIFAMLGILKRKYLIKALVIGGLFLGAFSFLSPAFRERVSTMTSTHYFSNSDRIDLWNANLEMFREHPVLGVGNLQNEERTQEYFQKLGIKNAFVGHAHNTYLNFLSTNGLVGLVCYLWIMGYFMLMTLRLWKVIPEQDFWFRTILLGALGSQVLTHIGGLTQCNFKDAIVKHMFLFMLAMVASLQDRYKSHT